MTRKSLRRWRPLFQDQEIRTVWSREHRGWMLQRKWGEEIIWTEILEVPRWSSGRRLALAELRAVNTVAPPPALHGVSPDTSGWWSVRVSCSDCGSFQWRLPLRRKYWRGLRSQWEIEMARLLGQRVQYRFEGERCPACFEESIEDGYDLFFVYWYSVRYQDWHLRVPLDDGSVVVPLGLPSWAPSHEVRSKVDSVLERTNQAPFDWEKDL